METSFKAITNIQRWRFAALMIGSAFAMSFATSAFAAAPSLNSNGNATGTVGVVFSYTMTANQAITTWGAAPLSAGLGVNTTTAVISGTPTAAGTTSVVLTGTNANGTGTKTVTFTINPPPAPSITSAKTASGTVGVVFSYQITATNTPSSYGTTVSVPGVTFTAATGAFSGTPSAAGTFSGNITATNAGGTGSQTLAVTINPAPHAAPSPVATIFPAEVYTGDIVTLDGSASQTNPPGGTLTYTWQRQAPTSPPVSLAPNNAAAVATFTAPDPGEGLNQPVTFTLKVRDSLTQPPSAQNQTSDPVTTTVYALPVAHAGSDQTIPIRETEVKTVYLVGTGTISRGGPITFAWTQTGGPAVTWLTPQDIANPSFQTTGVAAPGTALTFDLVVGDGTRLSAHDQVGVALNTVDNNMPVANAGPDQSVEEQAAVTLNGSGSTDADNDPLSYTWTQDSGTTVILTGSNTAMPTFTAPEVPAGQNNADLVFKLVVNDGFSDSVPSSVTVHVDNTNDPPQADAKASVLPNPPMGGTVNVNGLDVVTLDGTDSSDQNLGDVLTYSWMELSNSITITNANTATAHFTAPNAQGTYTFKLTVSDGEFSSESFVMVAVAHVNHAPLANAGEDQSVPEGTTGVQLDGSTSGDEDGDTLTYSWMQTGGTGVILTGANTSMPTFTAPGVGPAGEDLTFQLKVDDGHGLSSTDDVTIKVTYVNQPPVADAGPGQTPDENTIVTLDGSGSTDPDTNPLMYSWSQFSGPTVALTGADTVSPTFTAPEVTLAEADIVMQLTVDDGYGGTDTADVTIHIHNVNHPPVADAGANFSVQWGHLVNLSGSGTDPDVEEQPALTYEWTPPAGVTLSGTGANVTFTAPPAPSPMYSGEQVLTFTLSVTDPNGAHNEDTIDVTVTNNGFNPIANAGGNKTVDEHSAVALSGSGSDPNDDPIHFTWTQVDGPSVALTGANTATLSFTAPFVNAAGAQLKFQLLVWDDFGGWGLDTATITVNNINDPPDITHAQPDPSVLWAPDHKLVPVHIIGVTDPNNNATVVITGVTQDEPTNGLGDGDTAIDAIISANHDSVQLRAERSGKGDGRVYWVHFTASDFEGGSSGQVKVMVPKSKKTDIAIDSGGAYDSTH